ncbi:MAG TPA: hypothetical protein PKC35_20010, partial [Leptospiraceae bacterium]|nr:hypothetical protein [Leptospiraceae bacterium]
MKKITFRDRMRYRFDNLMSRGSIALIIYLGLLTVALIVGVTIIDIAGDLAPADDKGEKPGFSELLWKSLLRTLDPGTMGGDTGDWGFLFSMFVVTIGGIFIVSTLVGILATGIDQKLEDLRKGKSL